jgi:glutamate N-acetyltransferase / amino-acid N-acetyltransferase
LSTALRADAEGSTKDISIQVLGAHTEMQAVEVGRAVARSNLFKCAMFGEDPNWGRILSAVGTTSAEFEPDRVNVSINGIQICTNGGAGASRDEVDLSGRDVDVTIDLREGEAQATIRTNDLSLAYVHENSAYST